MTLIYDKTDKGREEIATRRHQLALRMRTLLLLVDGKQLTADLLKKVHGLGLSEQHLSELLEQGFIGQIEAPSNLQAAAISMIPANHASNKLPAAPVPAVETPAPAPIQYTEQFHSLYAFYSESIRNVIGLRGYALQLKVGRAVSIDDFRELRQAYLDAVLKAGGSDVERKLRLELDQLLASPVAPS